MALWTDIITPTEATGILRVELEEREAAKGSLARWLPNVSVADTIVKFMVGQHGLVEPAHWRAFNAAPEIIASEPMTERLVSLAAISNNQPIDERTQLALNSMSSDQARKSVEAAIRRAAWSIADGVEAVRGTVFATGVATTNQHNFQLSDNFGRDAALTVTAAQLWTDTSADGLGQLDDWARVYEDRNLGQGPGALVMSRQAFRAFSRLEQFRQVLLGGASRPAGAQDVYNHVEAQGLPPVVIFDRSTQYGPVLPPDRIFLAPAPVDPNSPDGGELGATFWGQTVSGVSPEFGLLPGEQPGAVVGVYREDKVPYTLEVMADAITLPVARDANKVMSVKVL